MKRYVIEIAEEPYTNDHANGLKLYKAKGFNSLVFDEIGLSRLQPFEVAAAVIDADDPEAVKAIKRFRTIYAQAKESTYIRNPLAYALYETWKEFDK